jgi:hypothetical protein
MVGISSIAVGVYWPIIYFQNFAHGIDFDSISALSISILRIAEMINILKWPICIIACVAVLFFIYQAWKENTTHYTLSVFGNNIFIHCICQWQSLYIIDSCFYLCYPKILKIWLNSICGNLFTLVRINLGNKC